MSFFIASLMVRMGLLAVAAMLSLACLKAGTRLAPVFLGEREPAPSLREVFFRFDGDAAFNRVRIATALLASAAMLGGLLAVVIAARLAGWSPV